MTVIVEVDAASAEALQSAVGSGTAIVPGLEQLRRHLDVHPGSTQSCSAHRSTRPRESRWLTRCG